MSETFKDIEDEFLEYLSEVEPTPTIRCWWVKLNEENRITMVTGMKQEEEQFYFELPNDFDISSHNSYKIVDNELVYDEMVYPVIEPQPSENEQMRADIDYIAIMTGIEL